MTKVGGCFRGSRRRPTCSASLSATAPSSRCRLLVRRCSLDIGGAISLLGASLAVSLRRRLCRAASNLHVPFHIHGRWRIRHLRT